MVLSINWTIISSPSHIETDPSMVNTLEIDGNSLPIE